MIDGRRTLFLALATRPELGDHRVQGAIVVPGAAYLELALADGAPSALEAVELPRALVLPTEGSLTVHLVSTLAAFEVRCGSVVHARGRFAASRPIAATSIQPDGLGLAGAEVYARLRAAGNAYGPAFQAIERVWLDIDAATARLTLEGRPALVLLDAAVQLLAAAAAEPVALAMVGAGRLQFVRRPSGPVWARARVSGRDRDLIGDVVVSDPFGPVLELTGVRLRRLQTPPTFTVVATFTAEPVRPALEFWAEQLELPPVIQFAAAGQAFQQLLDPGSLLARARTGTALVLVRPEDWWRDRPTAALPAGKLAGVNSYETEYLRREIFERGVYGRHRIELRDRDWVLDVGANIGMFTLWARARCPTVRVVALEPSPPAFAALQENVARHARSTRLFRCAVTDRDGAQPFTTYAGASLFGGLGADRARDGPVLRSAIENSLRLHLGETPGLRDAADGFARARLDATVEEVTTRTLSSVIRELSIDSVGLLKIDVEGTELSVLAGIDEEHWRIVRQVVVEAHGNADDVAAVLSAHGLAVTVDAEDAELRGTGLARVYARRRPVRPAAEPDLEQIASEFAHALIDRRERTDIPWVVAICPASPNAREAVAAAEHRLAAALTGVAGLALITPAELLGTYPVARYADPRAEALGEVPYTRELFAALGTLVARRLVALRQSPPKALALDCDGTLWDGVAAEDGTEGVRIGAGQRAVQELALRRHDAGTLLCLCSRNDPRDVSRVFHERTDMLLGRRHFAATSIGWQPKPEGLSALAVELGLGLESFALIDDDPVQCAEVRARCPEAIVLELPRPPEEVASFLAHVWAFDHEAITPEDARRSDLYRTENKRRASRRDSPSFAAFIASLDLRVDMSPCARVDLPRVAQLLQRVTQFTTTASRPGEAQLARRAGDCVAVRVTDRFGEYGLVGTILLEPWASGRDLSVEAMVLSCRALGRGVEHRMLAGLGALACERGAPAVVIHFARTARNVPARRFLDATLRVRSGTFTLPAEEAAAVRFDPEADAPLPPAPVPAATAVVPPEFYGRIAATLRDVPAIMRAIERRRRRTRPALASDYAAPRDGLERTLAEVWQRVVGVDRVGIDDNFFELGGTSLQAVQAIAELPAGVGAELGLVALFEWPTIRGFAGALSRRGTQLEAGPEAHRDSDAGRRGERRRGLQQGRVWG